MKVDKIPKTKKERKMIKKRKKERKNAGRETMK